MISFIQKHWKKIVLSLCALFWSGCEDDAAPIYGVKSSPECTLMQMCPEYGAYYVCENEADYDSPDINKKCTMSYPSCSNYYNCEDGTSCSESTENNVTIFDCSDKSGTITKYTEEDFNSKYYVKEKTDED